MWVLILILHLYPHNSRWPTIPIQLYQAQWRDRVSGHLLNHLLRNLRDHGCCFGGFESQLLNGILEDRSTILTIQPKSFWARGWRNMVTRLPAKHEPVGGEWTKTVAMRFSGRPYDQPSHRTQKEQQKGLLRQPWLFADSLQATKILIWGTKPLQKQRDSSDVC